MIAAFEAASFIDQILPCAPPVFFAISHRLSALPVFFACRSKKFFNWWTMTAVASSPFPPHHLLSLSPFPPHNFLFLLLQKSCSHTVLLSLASSSPSTALLHSGSIDFEEFLTCAARSSPPPPPHTHTQRWSCPLTHRLQLCSSQNQLVGRAVHAHALLRDFGPFGIRFCQERRTGQCFVYFREFIYFQPRLSSFIRKPIHFPRHRPTV